MSTWITPRRTRRSAAPARRGLLAADNFFDDLWPGFGLASAAGASFTPRLDVKETDNEYVVTAELPGIEEKDVEITLEDNVLRIRGEKRTEHTDEKEGYKHVETVSGRFERTLAFPVEIDADSVSAKSKNGILAITLPKPAESKAQTHTIPVTTA